MLRKLPISVNKISLFQKIGTSLVVFHKALWCHHAAFLICIYNHGIFSLFDEIDIFEQNVWFTLQSSRLHIFFPIRDNFRRLFG